MSGASPTGACRLGQHILLAIPLHVLALPVALAAEETSQPSPVEKPAATARFSGRVREAATKTPLDGAEVALSLDETGVRTATCGADGTYDFGAVVPGEYLVVVSAGGFETYSARHTVNANDEIQLAFFLVRRSYNRFETLVREKEQRPGAGTVSLGREELSAMPGTYGDPLRALEAMPSMAQGPLAGGQLIVRGAPPRNTAIYIDGVQVPQLYHFGFLRSVIEPEFIDRVDLWVGGAGPQYGRFTAGLVEVRSRKLNDNRFHATADINPLETAFYFGGTVALDGEKPAGVPDPYRVRFAVAARRTYVDAWLPLFANVTGRTSTGQIPLVAPLYWDYQAKLEYAPFARHSFSVFAFGSSDELAAGVTLPNTFDLGLKFQLTFHRVVARWNFQITENLSSQLQVYSGLDRPFLGLRASVPNADTHSFLEAGVRNTAPILGLRHELRYELPPTLSLSFGLDGYAKASRLAAYQRVVAPEPFEDGKGNLNPRVSRDEGSVFQEDRVRVEVAPFFQATFKPIPFVTASSGVRLEVMKYSKNAAEIVPLPRLALRVTPFPGTALIASTGGYAVAPKAYEVSDLFGDSKLTSERSWLSSVGFEHELAPRTTLAVNLFANWRWNVLQSFAVPINVDADVGMPLLPASYSNAAQGRSYGVDFMLRREMGENFFGWVSYTLSRSEVRPDRRLAWQLFNFDQTHILAVAGQYRLPWHLPFREWGRSGRLPGGILWRTLWALLSGDAAIGARFRYVTGNPENYILAGLGLPDQEIGETRYSPLTQLDLRVDYKIPFDLALVTLSGELINALASKAAADDIPQIPRIPLVSLNVQF